MSQAYIDSASLHHLVLALRHPKPLEWMPWVWEVLEGVTCALWSQPQFQIAPDPSPHKGARGPFDQLLMELSPMYTGIAAQDAKALKATRQWVNRNPQGVRTRLNEVKAVSSFTQWLDWYVSFFFGHHSKMHGALFTYELIPQLGRVLDCSTADLEQVHQLSQDNDRVAQWAKDRPNTEDYQLALDAFVLSTLLRGRYHDCAARNLPAHIMHHPMREVMLAKRRPPEEFSLSNTEQYLTKVVFASALVEPTLEGRLGMWSENVLKVRHAAIQGRLDLRPKDSDAVALELAIDAVKRADVRCHPRYLELVLDAAMSLGVATLTSFSLTPWYVGPPVALGELVMSRKLRVGQRLAGRFYTTRRRLQDLARSKPGRLERILQRTRGHQLTRNRHRMRELNFEQQPPE